MRGKAKQYLVLGLGRFGSSVARSLCRMGHEVLAVDADAELVEALAQDVTQAVQADATDEDALESLGVRNFDAAIVSIGQNVRDSILVCVLLKEMGVPMLIAKAIDDLHAKVLRKVGVDRVVFPERDMGVRVARSLATPGVVDLIELSGDHQIAEITLPKGWEGQSLAGADVRRRYNVSILAIQRDGQFIASPQPDLPFKAGDILLALCKQSDIEALDKG